MRFALWSTRDISDALRQYVERRLQFALDRFAARIDRIEIRLEDVNGPRGGLDRRCRVGLVGRPSWRIHVEGSGATFEEAIDAAATRAARSVGRLLTRVAETNREVAV
jgi:ribosome-associated translation inhibitor RaiA